MMNSAQELGRLSAARAREKIHARARQLCVELGRPIPPALKPELLLTERVVR